MILLQKLQVHSKVYVNGKLLNLEKSPGRQVASVFVFHKDLSNCPIIVTGASFIYLADEFYIFSFLMLLKEMRTQGQSKISSCCLV